ncbi:Adenylate cyclase type 10 [Phlyctochytrium planicorne]|nr:Adenylate cyclase type 10 [Phlyctochytrium planicorne]
MPKLNVVVDDKGQTLLAFFGLPPWNRENNAAFAVRAAIDIIEEITKLRFGDIAIAISTGDVLVSFIGNEIRSEASFLGDSVNTSARLLQFAVNSIACDSTTHLKSPHLGNHSFLGERDLKGRRSATEVWSIHVTGQPGSSGPSQERSNDEMLPTFGYQKEITALKLGMEEWLNGQKQFFAIIEGTSGSGKTKLGKLLKSEASKLSLPIW